MKMTNKERISLLEEKLAVDRDMIRLLAKTVEKLVEVVCTTEETAPAASREGLTQRIPF